MKFIVGKKIGMTELIAETGVVTPVTVVQAEDAVILDIKTQTKDQYNAVKVAFGNIDKKKINKPMQGIFDKKNIEVKKYIKEFRVDNIEEYKIGKKIDMEIFQKDEEISVRGKTKGRGFAGTIKRWNFRRGPMAHGSKSHRIPGSIGAGTSPSRVTKGKKMAGRYGNEVVTIKGLRIMKIDKDKKLIFIKGAIPGANQSIVEIFN